MVKEPAPSRTRVALLAAIIFGLNAALCWPLFRIEYLNDLQSNEGSFISMARFLIEHWPHIAWFPWFNGGTPLENAYFPLVPALVAATAALVRCSPAHAFHFLSALTYCLGPVFLFLFARKVSGLEAPSVAAALAWTLFSPALLVPQIRGDSNVFGTLYRLYLIVHNGETPHDLALGLLPFAWLLLARYWEAPTLRRFAFAALVTAAIMASNAFGMAVITISAVLLWLVIDGRAKHFVSTCVIFLTAYLLICRLLPPSLLREAVINSQTLEGDSRHGWWVLALLPAMALLWLATRRISDPIVRFGLLFTGFFGGVVALRWIAKVAILPVAHRYVLEAETGVCLLASFGLYLLWRRMPGRSLAFLAIPLLGFVAFKDYRFGHHLIRSIDITQSVAYRESAWIREHLPDQRVMASGDTEFWFNLFTDNPQLAAGHEAGANWVERVAVYTIYSGQNAGDQDGPISVLWLKAFGCGAITVPGLASHHESHPLLHPEKFVGQLPLVWHEGADFIYQVPLRSTSLAHVIPSDTLVAARPVHGLDVAQLRRYVEALENPAFPLADIDWQNPEQGSIAANVTRDQVVSLQISYDPGWRANVNGSPVALRSDGLGMIAIDPACAGECMIDLKFDGGIERRICFILGILVLFSLVAMTGIPMKYGSA